MKDINSIAASGELLDGRYKLLRPLSSDGGTADVWLALDTNTIDEVYDEASDTMTSLDDSGIKVAIKIYRPKNALDLGEQRFREEFKIVFNCHHENLVQPINFSIYEGIPYLVLPYCSNGSSETLEGKITDKDKLWKYISDVSAGMSYLHSYTPTIVHHDIKPANILIDDNNNFAITDFGISSQRGINRDGYDDTQSGTMAYMAPERFREDYESIPESDIWSFGATLYELITGRVPFGEDGGLKQLETGTEAPPINQPIPHDIKNLINDCLSPDIKKRPSAAAIHKAAQGKQYPLRKKNFLIYGLAALVVAGVVLGIIFLSKGESDRQAVTPTNLEPDSVKYARAMVLMQSSTPEGLSKGLSILDSLDNNGYIPAIYEEAFTYGWYADSASVARKNILGIDYYPATTDVHWLPLSDYINRKAIGYLTKIEAASDPEYPEINAQALYKLATYYCNTDKVFNKNIDRAIQLCEQALEWAEKSGNKALYNKIEKNLKLIKQQN